ncbi:MAG TPA: hypothetical protein VJ834_09690 [Burkholderiales bacterium]|nr:hypothetical protein [Burkholderiales bacterium]
MKAAFGLRFAPLFFFAAVFLDFFFAAIDRLPLVVLWFAADLFALPYSPCLYRWHGEARMPSRNPLVNLFSVLARAECERFCPVKAVRMRTRTPPAFETGAQAIRIRL